MDDDPLDLKLSEGFEAPLGRFDGRALNKYLNVAVIVTILCAMVGKVITVDAEISRGWTTFEIITRLVPDNWSGYSDFLQEQPVLTKACTSGFVYTLGDCIAQSTEGKGIAELDRLRVLRSASCGFFAHGPLSHVWYNVAESIFDSLHMSAWYFTPLKVALDQVRAARPALRERARARARPLWPSGCTHAGPAVARRGPARHAASPRRNPPASRAAHVGPVLERAVHHTAALLHGGEAGEDCEGDPRHGAAAAAGWLQGARGCAGVHGVPRGLVRIPPRPCPAHSPVRVSRAVPPPLLNGRRAHSCGSRRTRSLTA